MMSRGVKIMPHHVVLATIVSDHDHMIFHLDDRPDAGCHPLFGSIAHRCALEVPPPSVDTSKLPVTQSAQTQMANVQLIGRTPPPQNRQAGYFPHHLVQLTLDSAARAPPSKNHVSPPPDSTRLATSCYSASRIQEVARVMVISRRINGHASRWG